MFKCLHALAFILSLCIVNTIWAADEITITTYYPSPYGSYNEIEVARSVRFRPHADKASIELLSNPRSGEMAYAQSEDEFYYYNGSAWVSQSGTGGGGATYVNWGSNTCATDYTVVYTGTLGYYFLSTTGGLLTQGPSLCINDAFGSYVACNNVGLQQGFTYKTTCGNLSTIPCAVCVKN